MPGVQGSECENPNCTDTASKTYSGENGNQLRVCQRHYYKLVSGSGLTGASVVTSQGSSPAPDFEGIDPVGSSLRPVRKIHDAENKDYQNVTL